MVEKKKINTYRDLLVWEKAMQLVTGIYVMTKKLPKEELYGIVAQIRRCCISIPSNIAEGYGRKSTNDYIRFLQIATGSLYELQTQLEICMNLKYVSKKSFEEIFKQSREIERMLSSLIRKLGPNK